MKYFKTICILLILVSLHSCGSKTPWNPYLSMKEKPSEKQMRENNKIIARGNKAYLEQRKKNKEEIAANNAKALSMKKHYKLRKKKVKKQRNKRAQL